MKCLLGWNWFGLEWLVHLITPNWDMSILGCSKNGFGYWNNEKTNALGWYFGIIPHRIALGFSSEDLVKNRV